MITFKHLFIESLLLVITIRVANTAAAMLGEEMSRDEEGE